MRVDLFKLDFSMERKSMTRDLGGCKLSFVDLHDGRFKVVISASKHFL